MQFNEQKLFPITKTFYEYLPKPFLDEPDANTKYVGYAGTGVDEEDSNWLIEKHIKVGTVTKVLYPNGCMDFKFSWTNRATYNYSR